MHILRISQNTSKISFIKGKYLTKKMEEKIQSKLNETQKKKLGLSFNIENSKNKKNKDK